MLRHRDHFWRQPRVRFCYDDRAFATWTNGLFTVMGGITKIASKLVGLVVAGVAFTAVPETSAQKAGISGVVVDPDVEIAEGSDE